MKNKQEEGTFEETVKTIDDTVEEVVEKTENSADNDEETLQEVVENTGEEVVATNSLKKCSKCGVELNEEQIFCPKCGNKRDFQINEEVSSAIEKFNQGIEKKAKKKKNKVKILIVLLSIIAVLVAAVIAMYCYFNSKAETLIEEIKSNNVTATTISDDYNALTPIGQMFFKEEIVNAFVDLVSSNQYVNTTNLIVDEELIDNYEKYKEVSTALDITSEDDTNVVEYIDAVLKLAQYEKYNDVSRCILNSASDYADCLEYIKDAGDFSTYRFMRLYIGYAYSSAGDAVAKAKIYSSGDELCNEYIDALETLEDELGDLYYDIGYYSSASVNSALDTITGIVSDIADAKDSVEDIVDTLPEIK